MSVENLDYGYRTQRKRARLQLPDEPPHTPHIARMQQLRQLRSRGGWPYRGTHTAGVFGAQPKQSTGHIACREPDRGTCARRAGRTVRPCDDDVQRRHARRIHICRADEVVAGRHAYRAAHQLYQGDTPPHKRKSHDGHRLHLLLEQLGRPYYCHHQTLGGLDECRARYLGDGCAGNYARRGLDTLLLDLSAGALQTRLATECSLNTRRIKRKSADYA